jgi:hypothetical protein
MRGRKPIPTSIKRARGNPGKHRLNNDEPQPRKFRDVPLSSMLKPGRYGTS